MPSNTASPIPVKIVVSGGFGVGKTTTVGALSEIPPLTTEGHMTSAGVGVDVANPSSEKTTTTVAMDFGRITLDESVVMYMFGTPGQDRFGFMWNDIADGALGAIILVDPSRVDDCYPALDFFDKVELPYVIAVNAFNGRENLSLQEIREIVNVDASIPVLPMDARNREHVKHAVLELLTIVLQNAQKL